MKTQPKVWRKFRRHPLSAEYPDLSGAAAENMLEGIKKFGVLNQRAVTIYEGMVLDGWQMYQACVEAGVKPKFQHLPKGITAEEFVEVVNNHRRHETQDMAVQRIVARRKKVAELRQQGLSTPKIATELKVSQPTVVRDLAAVNGREPGDDTDAVEAEKKAPKNGAVLYDPHDVRSMVGGLIREVDKCAKCFGVLNTPEAKGFQRRLAEWRDEFVKWWASLKKARR